MGASKQKVKRKEINGKTAPNEIADELNKSFCDIGPGLAAKIPGSLLEPNLETLPGIDKFKLKSVTEREVSKHFMKLSTAKANGWYGTAMNFLKCNIPLTVQILTFIINLSIATKTVPAGWKMAEVILLHKSGDKLDSSNYCPITSL